MAVSKKATAPRATTKVTPADDEPVGAGLVPARDTPADDVTAFVRAKHPLTRRCRCNHCFSAKGHTLTLSTAELALLQADSWLVVEVQTEG